MVGLIGTRDAAREAFLGLTTLQHRGQDAAGITTYDADGFHTVKNIGLVDSVFTRENTQVLTGSMAVGHARYSTIGRGDLGEVQPFLINYPFGLGMVHNGNVVNVEPLARELRISSRRHLLTRSDTEVILNLLAESLAHSPAGRGETELNFDQLCDAVSGVFKKVSGSFSIVTLIADEGLLAFRDPHGIRPLVVGSRQTEDGGVAHMVASESVALSFLGYEAVRDLEPGEVLFINPRGKVYSRVLRDAASGGAKPKRPCMFEWVYFASPESVSDGVPVYGSRINLGKNLARLIQAQIDAGKIEPDLVVPVPETSRIAAIALAEEIGVPYREVLIKNRYIKRTFILDSQEKRQSAVNLKLSPVRSEIEGKKVLLVDDSIVRGTTSRKIIELVRRAGASKVYFVSTCPPIQHPCFYGIDFPDESELIASGRTAAEIERELGADAVIYQDIPGLQRSIAQARLPSATGEPFDPCTACLDGKYPTDVSAGRGFARARTSDRKSSS